MMNYFLLLNCFCDRPSVLGRLEVAFQSDAGDRIIPGYEKSISQFHTNFQSRQILFRRLSPLRFEHSSLHQTPTVSSVLLMLSNATLICFAFLVRFPSPYMTTIPSSRSCYIYDANRVCRQKVFYQCQPKEEQLWLLLHSNPVPTILALKRARKL